MTFHEIRFPVDISAGSSGGPERLTDIVSLRSGHEDRNSIWYASRHRYDASMGIRSVSRVYEVLEFFEGRRGRLYGFRWKDWSDYKSCPPNDDITSADQTIGTGDGSTKRFQLTKSYSANFNPWIRIVRKPVEGTVLISLDGEDLVINNHFTVEIATGIVNFTVPPGVGKIVKAGFEFDVPVRFNSDFLNIAIENFQAGTLPQIDILEILE